MSKQNAFLSLFLIPVLLSGACASTYSIIDPSEVQVSPNSRVVARTVLPAADRFPALAEHLALAEEIYNRQLKLLRERRNKTRARKRDLNFAAYGIMGASALTVGGLSIGSAAGGANSNSALVGAGAVSLFGLGLGTILQLSSAMQEEPSVTDDKVNALKHQYAAMTEKVRLLAGKMLEPGADTAQLQAQIAATIEEFKTEVSTVNVKG
jgi:hypothetical protein